MSNLQPNLASLVALCAALFAGCAGDTDSPKPDQNPLLAVDVNQISEVRFSGTSSPVPGDHFASADPQLIREVYAKASSLRKADASHITMPGNITFIQFFAENDAFLSEISVGGDGSTVVLHGSGDANKTLVAASPDFCLYCFNLLKTNALPILQEMLTLDDRGNRELHLKSYPFDQISPKPETPSPAE